MYYSSGLYLAKLPQNRGEMNSVTSQNKLLVLMKFRVSRNCHFRKRNETKLCEILQFTKLAKKTDNDELFILQTTE
jgi:hypothetical protein